jgi:hypothetical protein
MNGTSEGEVLKLYCLERALVALLIAAYEVGVDNLVAVVSLPSFFCCRPWHYSITLEIEM